MFNRYHLSLALALTLPARHLLADDAGKPTDNPTSYGEPATQYQAGPGAIPQTITSPLGKQMKLKWNDEFDAVTDKDGQPYIDRSKWQTTFWQGSSQRTLTGNGEAEYYMDKDYGGKNGIPVDQRPNPFSFETPGILTITASKVPEALWPNYWMGKQRCFSSGLLVSDRRFTMKYGYIEGRFKVPMEKGSWPAFWMLRDDIAVDDPTAEQQIANHTWPSKDQIQAHRWPPEIDILESLGIWKTKFDAGYIAPKGEHIKISDWMHNAGTDLSTDFHTWGLEWDENVLVWTFDGKIISHGNSTPSFQHPFYLLVNLAVGGNWYSQITKGKAWEVDESTMPWKMECDYVRVYQADDGTPPAPAFPDATGPGAGHNNGNGTAPTN